MLPHEAQTRIDEIRAERAGLQARDDALGIEEAKLIRIVNGDDLHDAYFRAEQERERQRQIDITSGRDPIALAQQAANEEAAQRLLEEQARAAKNKVVADARWEEVERMSRQTTILR